MERWSANLADGTRSSAGVVETADDQGTSDLVSATVPAGPILLEWPNMLIVTYLVFTVPGRIERPVSLHGKHADRKRIEVVAMPNMDFTAFYFWAARLSAGTRYRERHAATGLRDVVTRIILPATRSIATAPERG